MFEEPFWLATPKDGPLADATKISLADLNNQEMLLLEEGHCLRGQALDVCFSGGAKEQSGFQATSLETLRHMIGEGMGMTLMPELSVNKTPKRQDAIRYIPFKPPVPTRRIGMLHRKNSYRLETYRKLQSIIEDQLKNN